MGLGGSEGLKKADKNDESKLDGQIPCMARLRVRVKRRDTKAIVPNLIVRLKQKRLLHSTKATAVNTGIADFGKVCVETYVITVNVGGTAQKFKAPRPRAITLVSDDVMVNFELVPIVRLALVLIDEKNNPVENVDWSLTAPPVQKEGTTGADGAITIDEFPYDAVKATLKTKYPASAVDAAAADSSLAATYPPPIKPADFKDKDPAPRVDQITWKLTVKNLEDGDNDAGVLARLHNLGFAPGAPPGDPKRLKRALKAYEQTYGAARNIADDIKKRHDAP